MTEDGVVLKALKSYRLKLNRDFKAVDELMHKDYLTPMNAAKSEMREFVRIGRHDKKALDRMRELTKQYKELERAFKKSISMATSDRWVKLSLELEEINGAIAGVEFTQGSRRR